MLGVFKKSGAVAKMRILQPQLSRALVHRLHERLLRTAKMLRHGDGAVVGRYHGYAFEHLVNAHLFALFEENAAPAEGGGPRRGYDRILKAYIAAVNGLDYQQQRHDLGDTGRRDAFVRVLFVDHLSGDFFHQHRGRRGDLYCIVTECLNRICRRRKHQRSQNRAYKSFHAYPSN